MHCDWPPELKDRIDQCLGSPPSHSGKGWRTLSLPDNQGLKKRRHDLNGKPSGQKQTGSTWYSWARSCAGLAISRSSRRWHGGSPSWWPPRLSWALTRWSLPGLYLQPAVQGAWDRHALCRLSATEREMVSNLQAQKNFSSRNLVVMAVIRESSSSLFSFNFFTRDSMARLENASLSPPCLKISLEICQGGS